ncbi:Hypothetical predicted protein [Cloeon dipterum]|uniref:Kazal-like domain-containing protein n=1 Tax=Cloeon dipterum TaxID=197152 RepID=A0A8S1DZR4_9INSE|nr:Hypothetical predicted protein [Cloeon dipterum]
MKYVLVCFVACMVLVGATAQGVTGNCPKVCNEVYRPVCGKNSKGVTRTFSNECELRLENCKYDFVKQRNACMVLVGATAQAGIYGGCRTVCSFIYSPACGKNSKGEMRTFINDCHMTRANCNGKNGSALLKI